MKTARLRRFRAVWLRSHEVPMHGPSSSLKLMPLLGIFALVLLLAGCDRCGDWVKSEGGNTLIVCKGDGPKPQ